MRDKKILQKKKLSLKIKKFLPKKINWNNNKKDMNIKKQKLKNLNMRMMN